MFSFTQSQELFSTLLKIYYSWGQYNHDRNYSGHIFTWREPTSDLTNNWMPYCQRIILGRLFCFLVFTSRQRKSFSKRIALQMLISIISFFFILSHVLYRSFSCTIGYNRFFLFPCFFISYFRLSFIYFYHLWQLIWFTSQCIKAASLLSFLREVDRSSAWGR